MKTQITLFAFFLCSLFAQAQQQANTSFASIKSDKQKAVEITHQKKLAHVKDGLLHGELQVYNEAGYVIEKREYAKGKRHGEWKFWNNQGELTAILRYNKGMKHGAWELYNDNGSKKAIMHYKNGTRVGKWQNYDTTGKLLASKDYGMPIDTVELLSNTH